MSTLIETCIESQFMETSQVIKLNIIDDQSNHLNNANVATTTKDINNGNGKSFLEYLSNISPKENMDVYFHPLSNSTSSRLSEKSLQLCTENLGCETGTTFIMDTTSSLSYSPSKPQQVSYSYSIKKVKSYSAFPPPLTTMCGYKSLQIISNREGGRLITKAFEIPSQQSCFVAHRTDGRLRLRVSNDINIHDDDDDDDDDVIINSPQEENEDEAREENEHDDVCPVNDDNDVVVVVADDDDNDVVVVVADDDDDGNDEEADDDYGDNIVVGSSYDDDIVEVEKMEKEKFPRRFVRCKECSKGLGNNWEPLWVATS